MEGPNIAIVVEAGDWPAEAELEALTRRAVDAAVEALAPLPHVPHLPLSPAEAARERELSVLFTDDAAMQKINREWRGKDRPTNVLSFPQPAGPLLGDVILAAETVAREAALADKRLEDHMAHLIIHGFLHLLGYDHETGPEAEEMEQLERVALKRIGIADPYATADGR